MCSTRPLLQSFSKHFLHDRVFRVHIQSAVGPPTSAMESQVLFTHLNKIHFDVTFERITSAWGSMEEVSTLLCYWLKPTTVYLSFTDGRYPWPWATIGCAEMLLFTHTHTFTSLIPLLSFCQSASVVLLFHSPSIVLNCPPFLIHQPNRAPCHFKARSDSLHGTCSASM